MSIFDPTTDQTQGNEAHQSTEETNKDDYVGKLVEQKGDIWSDPQVVAKGKLEADALIDQLKEQVKQLEEKQSKQDYAAELKALLQDKANPQVATPVDTKQSDTTDQTPTTKDAVSEEVLESLVSKVLTTREEANTVNQNIAEVEKQMEATFGTEAQKVIVAKSEELGIGAEQLRELAGKSPTAFMTLMGQPKAPETNETLKGTLNSAAAHISNREERGIKYYTKIMRENPKLWSNPQTQKQMQEDKKRLGARFFN